MPQAIKIPNSNYWTSVIDDSTGLSINYEEVSTWWDGSPMSETKVDGEVYIQIKPEDGGAFARRVYNDFGEVFLEKNTMAQMKALSPIEILLLQMGRYRGVTLNGYYGRGDTPQPINYIISTTSNAANDGAIVQLDNSPLKMRHDFKGWVSPEYFGARLDGSTDDTLAWQRTINYANNSLKIRFNPGRSLISSTLNLRTRTHIEGTDILECELMATFEGNVLQYLNGYIRDPDTNEIIDYGSPCQAYLSSFSINNNIPVTSDSFGRLTSFCMGTAIHLEGFRYMGKLYNLRISGGFNKAIYLWGSWGCTIDLMDIQRCNYGLHSEAAGNGMRVNRFFCKRTGNINTGTYGSGGGIYYNGGTNPSFDGCIIENANTSSPAIYITGAKNFAIKDCYFERQTTATRSLRILNSEVGLVQNVNFELCNGVEISGSNSIALKNVHVYGDDTMTQTLAFRIVPSGGLCNNITLENCKLNFRNVQNWAFSETSAYLALTEEQARLINNSSAHIPSNYFRDPMFARGVTGTASAGVTASFIGSGLSLVFNPESTPVFYRYPNVYTHNKATGGRLNLLIKLTSITGETPKYIAIEPSSGSTVEREIPAIALPGGYFYCSINNATNGYSYSIRIGIQNGSVEEESMTISAMYFGFGDLKNLQDKIGAPVANDSNINTLLTSLRNAGIIDS